MRITNFRGMRPKVAPENLGPNDAERAENCTFESGALSPIRAPKLAGSVMGIDGKALGVPPAKIHLSDNVWLGWEKPVFVAPDPLERAGADSILYVQDGVLYRTSGAWTAQGFRQPLGISAPCNAPVLSDPFEDEWQKFADSNCPILYPNEADGELCENDTTPIVWTFIATYVNGCHEESAPSPPSEPILVDKDTNHDITLPGPHPANATKVRFYQLQVGSDDSAGWALFAEEEIDPFGDVSTKYLANAHNVQDMLITEGWEPPPKYIEGVAIAGDEVTVIWQGRSIWLSEVRQPHAYPRKWELQVDYPITEIVSLTDTPEGNLHYTAVVLTTGPVYLLTGALPEEMSLHMVSRDAGHLNVHGAMSYAGVVVWATFEGLLALNGGRVVNLTAEWFSRETWRGVAPHKLRLGYHDNHIVAMAPDETGQSFMFPWARQDNPYSPDLVYLTTRSPAVEFDLQSRMHIADPVTDHLWEWRAAAEFMSAYWQSGPIIQRGLWHPTAAKVLSQAPRLPPAAKTHKARLYHLLGRRPTPEDVERYVNAHPDDPDVVTAAPYLLQPVVEFFLMAHGPVFARPVWSLEFFRLPRIRRMVNWQFAIRTQHRVVEVHIQTSGEDLTQEGGHA